MSTTSTTDGLRDNSNTALLRLILSLRGPQQQAFISALLECGEQLRTDAERLMSIVDDPNSRPGERGRAWNTLLDQFHLLPDDEGRYGMDLARSEAGAAQRYPLLASEVEQMDSQEALFADRLRQIMKDKNITQQELAARIDCSQPAISQMLNRKCRPQRKTLDKIASALRVDVRELWPDLEMVAYMDEIAATESDGYVMSEAEADGLRESSQPRSSVRGKPLRSRKDLKANHE
jgi:transcriptional regulator with XRE-family HTH domain